MGAKRNNKNYPWDRDGHAKDPNKMFDQDGWCRTLEVFKKYWDKFPNAPCVLTVRNFNKIAGRITIEIKTPFNVRSYKIDWNRLYYHEANLADFFPESLIALLKEEELNSGSLSVSFLLKIGDLIATALNREFGITHQEGGDQIDADFTDYGPFLPNKFVQFQFDPKASFGFLDPQNGDFVELDLFGEE